MPTEYKCPPPRVEVLRIQPSKYAENNHEPWAYIRDFTVVLIFIKNEIQVWWMEFY